MRFNYQLMDNFNLLLLFIAAVKWPAEDWKLIYAYESRWIIHICMLGTGAAAAAKQRRHLGQIREHPYQRAGALSWIRRAQSQYCTRLREKVSFLETYYFYILSRFILFFVISIYHVSLYMYIHIYIFIKIHIYRYHAVIYYI